MNTDKRKWIPVLLYLCSILFITILSREPHLIRSVKLVPFWSYYGWIVKGFNSYGRSIILNILLFIPLGFLCSQVFQKRRAILFCIVVSLLIEFLQFLTYFGLCDVDDLINNTIGGVLGALAYSISRNWRNELRKTILIILVTAGFASCVKIGLPNISEVVYEWEFNFDVTTIREMDGETRFDGYCYVYNDFTPEYQILLTNEEDEIIADVNVNGNSFSAMANTSENTIYELQVKFQGYPAIPTSTYLVGHRIEYVRGVVSEPENTDEIISGGLLKVFNADYDVYVYQLPNKIVWLVGEEIAPHTQIIYHLYTDDIEKSPENRRENRFNNMSFYAEGVDSVFCGNYRVFEAPIPTDYPITAIGVGYYTNSYVTWKEYFRPSNMKHGDIKSEEI